MLPTKTLCITAGLALIFSSVLTKPLTAAEPAAASRDLELHFKPATSTPLPPDPDGFIQRWLLLEPINKPIRSNAGFTESYVRNAFKEYELHNQLLDVPKSGDKVTVGGEELTWHAMDSRNWNVKVFRFASGLNKRTYGVVFWAVTVIDCPREIQNVRLAVGSNSASMWWLNGEEAVSLFTDRRMVMDDCVSKRVTLKKGRNVIRGAVINGPGLSDFCVRFIDENDQPVRDFVINLEKTGN
jgi:hypothetical protein